MNLFTLIRIKIKNELVYINTNSDKVWTLFTLIRIKIKNEPVYINPN